MKISSIISTMKYELYAAFIFMFVPGAVLAADPGALVPSCSTGNNPACGYKDLILLGQNFLTWSIYLVALVSVASIAYAGFLYVTSGGNEGNIARAHAVFGKVIWGIVITLAAWLIVKSILGWLGVEGDWTLLN